MENLRGIDPKLDLIEKFKNSSLYKKIKENKDEYLLCIRNNYIGIYYNSDRIAKVYVSRKELKAVINDYYLSVHRETQKREKGSEKRVTLEKIEERIETIKKNSDERYKSSKEKNAQQMLVMANNTNPTSKWFCFDIEYEQSIRNQQKNHFVGRTDILAISKKSPHRLAVIELKYNKESIGGASGIAKHFKDFETFTKSKPCVSNLKKEVKNIITDMKSLEIDIPQFDLDYNNINDPEFYFICLYDTPKSPRGTVGGYLFDDIRKNWQTKRISKHNIMKDLGTKYDIESTECPIKVKFLFKKVKSPRNLGITDILDTNQYDKE